MRQFCNLWNTTVKQVEIKFCFESTLSSLLSFPAVAQNNSWGRKICRWIQSGKSWKTKTRGSESFLCWKQNTQKNKKKNPTKFKQGYVHVYTNVRCLMQGVEGKSESGVSGWHWLRRDCGIRKRFGASAAGVSSEEDWGGWMLPNRELLLSTPSKQSRWLTTRPAWMECPQTPE